MFVDHTLQAVNLSCIRGQHLLFADLSFTLKKGEALLIEGPNGSGKSSLLRLLAGFLTPFHGDILWQQQSIHTLGINYSQHIAYVGHHHGLKLGLTVNENLLLAKHLALSKKLSQELLSLLQLQHHAHKQTCQLSAGQKRKLALAKLFMSNKPLWLIDEPFTALDATTQTLFLSQLEKHLKVGGLCILSSHHPMTFNETKIHSLRLGPC